MSAYENDLIYTLCNFNRTEEKFDIYIQPALKARQQAIIFTPNVATIYYEIGQLHKQHVSCVAYTSNVNRNERAQIRDDFEDGKIQFLYATPRMYFENVGFRDFLDQQVLKRHLAYIVFDDAKFLFEYGYDTAEHKSYQNFSELKVMARDQPWIVVADAECADKLPEIAVILQLQNPMVMRLEYGKKKVFHAYEYTIETR